MNAPISATLTETQQIERALDELLKVAVSTKAPWPPRIERPVKLVELIDDHFSQTQAQRNATSLLDNPVGEAVRKGVTTFGKRLYEIGGLQLMTDVLDRVAEMDPTKQSWRIDIMDKRWDGIGSEGGRAGWRC